MADTRTSTFETLGHLASNAAMRGAIGAAMVLPYEKRVAFMGRLVSKGIGSLAGFEKRIRANLAHTCPDLSEAEIKKICAEVPDNAGRFLAEIYSGDEFVARVRTTDIQGAGLDALENARAEGRPVILCCAHMGNYDAARAALIHRGHNMGALYRRMTNPYFNAHYVRTISRIGEPLFEEGPAGVKHMVRHLRGGGILAILNDVRVNTSPNLTFFGQEARTSLATAELALKYNAPMIPVYSTRHENGLDFTVHMHAPIPHTDAITMTQAFNDDLEAMVRANMGQWFWIHRRWKNA